MIIHNAADILRMIESVDPQNSAKLDEIDMRIREYIDSEQVAQKQYTRSIDDQESIWPRDVKNFFFTITKEYDFAFYCDVEWGEFKCSSSAKTEALARLHCLIQAIDHNRALQYPSDTPKT